jgi:hypothetical protein
MIPGGTDGALLATYGDEAEQVTGAGDCIFACTECPWHSVPGEYPEAGACPDCGATVAPCSCGGNE